MYFMKDMTMLSEQTDLGLPQIIQGGMGVGVSNWELARAVSTRGQLGVVSGTALDSVMIRRLGLGDLDGSMRRGLAAFPDQELVTKILNKFYIQGGKADKDSYQLLPLPKLKMSRWAEELAIVANFVEVTLAKEGHAGLVGINYLEKIQLPTLPSLFGAMLAGVDYVLMGAGIPVAIPGAIESLARGELVELLAHVTDDAGHGEVFGLSFDPCDYLKMVVGDIKKPNFLAIVSSHIVAKTMMRKATGDVTGFVVENYDAGGHNAPPRKTRGGGDDVEGFGQQDVPDLKRIKALGKPFWLAGKYATDEKLGEAFETGAVGVQVGTAFAFCDESGITRAIKDQVIAESLAGDLVVKTDFQASPTGYPFKVVTLKQTVGEPAVYDQRRDCRICDLGCLREVYAKEGGGVGYRCPGEPEDKYLKKGGAFEATVGKQCLCNGLMATIGLGQVRGEYVEPALVTAGEDATGLSRFIKRGEKRYRAVDVLDIILASGGCLV